MPWWINEPFVTIKAIYQNITPPSKGPHLEIDYWVSNLSLPSKKKYFTKTFLCFTKSQKEYLYFY